MKVDPKKLAQAKEMYLQYKNAPEISEVTGINPRTIHYYQQNSWKMERDMAKREFFEAIASNKREILLDITNKSLSIIDAALTDLIKQPITLKEAKIVSEIFERIDKIIKLDEGKPTEIHTSIKPSTIIELKKRLSNDPFLQLEEENAQIVNESNVIDISKLASENS